MKDPRKALRKIRIAEEELQFATPEQAAKLTAKLVRWKASVFDERDQ
ncbi:MAG: hypothetical protein J6A38_05915 [Clostridia bacterium]|nr:hypothetical protein [Clostridia bacterium]